MNYGELRKLNVKYQIEAFQKRKSVLTICSKNSMKVGPCSKKRIFRDKVLTVFCSILTYHSGASANASKSIVSHTLTDVIGPIL